MDIEKAIREYLPTIIHMSLATCVDNKPWICEVHFSYDNDLNIYFRSLSNRRHSKEIALNPYVAGNIVTQHQIGDKPRGVYFEGKAEELKNVTEENAAFISYSTRFNTDSSILADESKPGGHRFYKVTVDKFYLFDGRESTPSQKYELDWKK